MVSNHFATSNTFKSIPTYLQACALFIAATIFSLFWSCFLFFAVDVQLALTFVCMCLCTVNGCLDGCPYMRAVMEKTLCSWINTTLLHGIHLESKLLREHHSSAAEHCIMKWRLCSEWELLMISEQQIANINVLILVFWGENSVIVVLKTVLQRPF